MANQASHGGRDDRHGEVRSLRKRPPPLRARLSKPDDSPVKAPLDAASVPPAPPRKPKAPPRKRPRIKPSEGPSRSPPRWLRFWAAAFGSGLAHAAVFVALAALAIRVESERREPLALNATAAEEVLEPQLDELRFELEMVEKRHVQPQELAPASIEPSAVALDTVDARSGGGGHIGLLGDLPIAPGEAFGEGTGGTGRGNGRGDGSGGRDLSTFGGIVDYVQLNGLDVVLTFDSTASMGGEIDNVKRRILQIGGALINKVPKTRIGICTYRDTTDKFLVVGLPLTDQLPLVHQYLTRIDASGGGDLPEAVHYGLQWSIANNPFRKKARKVILLFGDAPPHAEHLATCIMLAQQFHKRYGGIVSTITCRQPVPMPEFVAIARAGGGEACVIQDDRRIMEELLVLVFGGRYRGEVMKFFDVQEVPVDLQRQNGANTPR